MSQNFTRFLSGLALISAFWGMSLFSTSGALRAQGLQVSAGSATAAPGTEVCVPIRVTNFNNIVGMEFTLTYDPALLTFKSVRNFNLAGLTEASSFGFPGVGVNPSGRLKVSWFDPNVTGITVAGGTAIFEVCFTAGATNAAAAIGFTMPFEVVDGMGMPVAFVPQPGTITIGAGGGGGNPDPDPDPDPGGGGGGGTIGTGTFTLDIADTTVAANQPFCLNVKTGSFRDILGIELTINYNATVLAFDSVGRFNLAGLNAAAFGLPGQGTNQPGSIKLSWVDPNVTGVSIPDSTSIFAVCFRAITNNVTTSVTFAANPEVVDKDENFVPFSGVAGRVVVGSGSGGGGGTTGPFTLTVGSATVQSGQQFCLPVTTTNFTNILGMEFTITYNPAVLQFQAVDNLNLTGLTVEGSFGLPGMGANPIGTMKVSWNDPDAVGKTLNNGTTLFRVCFTAVGNNTTTQVGFSNTSEVIGAGDVLRPLTGNAGTVTISGTSGGGGNTNFSLVVGSKTSPQNQEVCLDVRVGRFTNILGMEFTMNYNPTHLTFTRVAGFNLNGLDNSSFGLPGQGLNPLGTLKLSWFDPAVTGITLTDSTSIFMACFTAVGPNGTVTPVSISPNGLEITNANQQPVPTNLVNGTVTIGSTQPPSGQLIVAVESKMAAPNAQVCLNVSVENFANIVGMEFNLAYNTDSLTFVSVGGFNLLGLNESNFGLPGVGVNPLGNIKLSWVDPNVTGVTLAGKVNIFQICFTVKANSGVARVRFDTQRVIEITNQQDQQAPRTLVNGLVTISGAQPPSIVTPAQITNVSCFGASTGAIVINVQGGSGNYTYRWSFQNAATKDLSNIPAGNYTVTVTDATTTLTATQTFTVSQPASAVQITSAAPTPVTCFGQSNGSILVAAQGGTGTLTYAWSGGLPAVANPTNLAAGSYTVTVRDANNCQVLSSPIIVTQPESALQVNHTTQNSACTGLSTGQITVTATGGTSPYQYNWSNNLPANQTTQTGLAAGTYRVTVTDARGCTVNSTIQVANNPSVVITAIQPTFIDAGNDGAVNITVSGGATPYRFSWTGPNNFTNTNEDISGLNTTGQYCVTVTDNAGCIDTACAMILQRLRFGAVTIRQACAGSSDGSISLNPTGGQSPYTFRWSNGSAQQNLTNLAPGAYGLTLTDALNNSISANFQVMGLTAITINGTVTDARGVMGVTNGGITLSVSGGQPNYTYRWNNNATSASLTGLAAGQYCVTVTDENGCTAERCFQVQFVALPLAFNAQATDNRCFGESRGSIRITVTGGLAPYFATFSDGTRIDAVNGIIERGNLPGGTYSFVVSDAQGTTVQGMANVSQPPGMSLSQTTVRHDTENAGCTGSISISISGGLAPYNVRWNSNNAGSLITNLCEGAYVPTVEDANGCVMTFSPIPVNVFSFQGSVVDNQCPGDQTGDVNLSVLGGAQPYTYAWLNTRGDTILRSKDLTNVAAGTYRVIVREASGNMLMKQFTINTVSNLSATVQISSNYRGFAVSCPESSDGIAMATGLNGIGSNYMYEWLLNNQLVASQQRIQNGRAGTYVVRVTDEAGCMTEASVTLNAPPPVGINGSVNDISCPGARDGDILIAASGGVPGSVYSFRWSTGGLGPRISFLPPGNYSATVTDANNCAATAMFNIREPQPLSVTVETTPATVGAPDCNGAARVTVSGGTRPYTYLTNVPGGNLTDSVFLKLCPGDYILQLRDARGCRTTPEQIVFNIQDRTLPCQDMRTVISPDGDGANDAFEIRCIEDLKDNRVLIFNQWGQLVYEKFNYSNDWDGRTANGGQLPEGPYYFVLEYTDIDGKRIQTKGSITLLRR